MLVGGLDTEVIELNRQAMEQMTAEKKLVIIPGATHLFEEQGKLEEVAKISADWFIRYLKYARFLSNCFIRFWAACTF